MSTEDFFTFKRESLLQYTVDNKVSALAPRMRICSLGKKKVSVVHINRCPLSTLTGIRIKRNVRAFPRDKETCPYNNEVSDPY